MHYAILRWKDKFCRWKCLSGLLPSCYLPTSSVPFSKCAFQQIHSAELLPWCYYKFHGFENCSSNLFKSYDEMSFILLQELNLLIKRKCWVVTWLVYNLVRIWYTVFQWNTCLSELHIGKIYQSVYCIHCHLLHILVFVKAMLCGIIKLATQAK